MTEDPNPPVDDEPADTLPEVELPQNDPADDPKNDTIPEDAL
jgi:hypothetical protein